jgi:hypothetical protein
MRFVRDAAVKVSGLQMRMINDGKCRFVLVAAILGFCAPIIIIAVFYVVRIHLSGYPESDIESDLQAFPRVGAQAGMACAWIMGLVASAGWQSRSDFWLAFVLVAGLAVVAIIVADNALPFANATLMAAVLGSAMGALCYRWHNRKRIAHTMGLRADHQHRLTE